MYSTSTGSAPVAWYNDMDNKMLMCLADMDIYRLFVIVHCLIGQLVTTRKRVIGPDQKYHLLFHPVLIRASVSDAMTAGTF